MCNLVPNWLCVSADAPENVGVCVGGSRSK